MTWLWHSYSQQLWLSAYYIHNTGTVSIHAQRLTGAYRSSLWPGEPMAFEHYGEGGEQGETRRYCTQWYRHWWVIHAWVESCPGRWFFFVLVWGSYYLLVWLVDKLIFVFVNLTQSRANQGEGITEENASIDWLIGRWVGHFPNKWRMWEEPAHCGRWYP